ncbi:hypothetical protein J23TS9_43050 [Paenibacillus sp. J23TS9]|nr:hypothetical protein J23TS9_43050 [Paenibacillus sp. J23TS9]
MSNFNVKSRGCLNEKWSFGSDSKNVNRLHRKTIVFGVRLPNTIGINIIRLNLLETNSSVNEKNYVMHYLLFG